MNPISSRPSDFPHELAQESADQERSLLVFHLGAQAYAIPIEDVVQIIPMLKLTPVPQLEHAIEGVANIHGKFVPVIRARSRLGMDPIPLDLYTPIILAMAGERQVGLIVDEVADVVRLPARKITSPDAILPENLDRAPILSGIVYQGDEAILVLDTRYLVRPSQARVINQVIQEMPERPRPNEAELFSQLVRAQPPRPCPEEPTPSQVTPSPVTPSQVSPQASLPVNNGNGGGRVAPAAAHPVPPVNVAPVAPVEVKVSLVAEPAAKAAPKPGKKRGSGNAPKNQANNSGAENNASGSNVADGSDTDSNGSSRGLRKSFKKAISAQIAELAADLPPVEGAPFNGEPSNGEPSNGRVKPADQEPGSASPDAPASDESQGTH